jgi:N-acetylglucosamine-6-sulfatase
MSQPNIVLILTDDQRWDTVGATHALPALAPQVMPLVTSLIGNQGIKFSRSFTTTAVCVPARASLLTGKYAHNHGVLRNTPPNGGCEAFDDSVTLATQMQGAGYRTALHGKYMNGYEGMGTYIPPGWDDWCVFANIPPGYFAYELNVNGGIVPFGSSPADYSTDVLASLGVSFIEDAVSSGQPFMLVYAPCAPHSPFTPAPRHAGLFGSLPSWRPANYNESNVSDKAPWLKAIPQLSASVRALVDRQRKSYMETLLAVDEAVGTIVQALTGAGVLDDTLLIYASDNSYMWGEHRLRAKEAPYDEAMRTPLMVRFPPLIETPRADNSLVLNVDLLPTILDVAGVPIPSGVNGESLAPLFPGPAVWRSDFLNEHWIAVGPHVQPVPDNALVRSEQYKYVEYEDGAQGTELYDLAADPYELVNRTNDPALAQTKATLAARLAVLRSS